MINIESAVGLTKRAINCKVIAITNCYQTAIGQGLLLKYNRCRHTFPVSWWLENKLDTRQKVEISLP